MAIYRLIQDSSFEPKDIEAMSTAYEAALQILGITDRNDPITEALAKNIVDHAKRGERNPVELCGQAVDAAANVNG